MFYEFPAEEFEAVDSDSGYNFGEIHRYCVVFSKRRSIIIAHASYQLPHDASCWAKNDPEKPVRKQTIKQN